MSMDRCTKCDELIDTDYFPEYYREEFDCELICDSCMEGIEQEDINHSVESRPAGWASRTKGEKSMVTKRTEMGMEYWATLAEGRDEPGQAAELRRAGKALDLLAELAGYLRENYDSDALDGTTSDMLDEADALLAT